MWSAGSGAGTRTIGAGQVPRQQSTPLSQQREDMFSPPGSGRAPPANQNVFRFGNQTNLGGPQPPQAQSSPPDDFPPLNRAAGDLSQERAASLMSALGFGGQSNAAAAGQNSQTENGLLNALSANRGAPDARSTSGMLERRSAAASEATASRY